MARLLFCLGVCMVVAVCSAQAPPPKQRCRCTPDQFVALLGQVNGLVISGKGFVQFNGVEIAADFTNMRVGEFIESTVMGVKSKIQVIINYKENYMYIINGQTCTKTAAMGSFEQCIPANAHHEGTFFMGAGSKTLNFDVYSYFINSPGAIVGNASFTLTQDECIPLSVIISGQTLDGQNIPILSFSGYSNVTLGIKKPERFFDIPAVCNQNVHNRVERSLMDDSEIRDKTDMVSKLHALLFPIHH